MADNNYKILDDCEVQVKKLHSIVKEMELAQLESKCVSSVIKSFHELGILPNSSTKEDAEKIAFDLNRVIEEVSLLCSEQVEFVEVMVKAFLSLDKKRGNELGMKQGGEIGE